MITGPVVTKTKPLDRYIRQKKKTIETTDYNRVRCDRLSFRLFIAAVRGDIPLRIKQRAAWDAAAIRKTSGSTQQKGMLRLASVRLLWRPSVRHYIPTSPLGEIQPSLWEIGIIWGISSQSQHRKLWQKRASNHRIGYSSDSNSAATPL